MLHSLAQRSALMDVRYALSLSSPTVVDSLLVVPTLVDRMIVFQDSIGETTLLGEEEFDEKILFSCVNVCSDRVGHFKTATVMDTPMALRVGYCPYLKQSKCNVSHCPTLMCKRHFKNTISNDK